MANASLKNLQQGLKSAAAPEPPKIEAAPLANRRPDRQGKTHLGGWSRWPWLRSSAAPALRRS